MKNSATGGWFRYRIEVFWTYRMNTVFYLLCDAYVDQERKIGNDPVGYKCSRAARYQTTTGVLICEVCLELQTEGRIKFHPPFGAEHQKAVLQSIMKRSGDNMANTTKKKVTAKKKSKSPAKKSAKKAKSK